MLNTSTRSSSARGKFHQDFFDIDSNFPHENATNIVWSFEDFDLPQNQYISAYRQTSALHWLNQGLAIASWKSPPDIAFLNYPKIAEIKLSEHTYSSSTSEPDSPIAISALASLYAQEYSKKPRHAAKFVAKFVELQIARRDFITLNCFIKEADLNKLNILSVINLIRPTYRVRDNLKNWSTTYSRAWEVVNTSSNENPEEIFIGMPKPR